MTHDAAAYFSYMYIMLVFQLYPHSRQKQDGKREKEEKGKEQKARTAAVKADTAAEHPRRASFRRCGKTQKKRGARQAEAPGKRTGSPSPFLMSVFRLFHRIKTPAGAMSRRES